MSSRDDKGCGGGGGVLMARISKDVEIGVGKVACFLVVVREDRAGGAAMARI